MRVRRASRVKLTFAVSRRVEQLRLRAQQRIVATAEYSVLRTEMENSGCPANTHTYLQNAGQ